MSEEHQTVRLTGITGRRLTAAGLPAWPLGEEGDYRVAPWLGDLLSVGLKLDDALLSALARVRDDAELREACLALVRMAPEENCGKAVALGQLLGVPLPAWMEAGATFREHGGKHRGRNRPADPVSATLPEPAEPHPWVS